MTSSGRERSRGLRWWFFRRDAASGSMVETELVLVVQHDQVFLRGFDADQLVGAMLANPGWLKYVSLASRSSMGYQARVADRFGLQISPTRVTPGLAVLPLLMWYDKPHLCFKDHYLQFVFEPSESGVRIREGEFPEDVLGQRLVHEIREKGMDAHEKYGTWVVDEQTPVSRLSMKRISIL
eukprot:TRINITY_DN13038_c0_g1_i3.p2 TRINITY_DN13038_c0_g1~~TRINITY_DN13038_c0_g1_i3.p2  ORF type:complete len:181 (-),score=30.12 TRINITY_DN13038_c0_g1_i3:293-835(-)